MDSLPSRAEAIAAWTALPRTTRREVVRRAADKEPHPDPDVAWTAYAWARRTFDEVQPRLAVGILVFAALPVLGFFLYTVPRGIRVNGLWEFPLALALGLLIGQASTWWIPRREIILANLATVVRSGRLRLVGPVPDPLVIPPARIPKWLGWAALGCGAAWAVHNFAGHHDLRRALFDVATYGLVTVPIFGAGHVWRRFRGRPVLSLGSSGLTVTPEQTWPWSSITRVDLDTIRHRGSTEPVVCWHLTEGDPVTCRVDRLRGGPDLPILVTRHYLGTLRAGAVGHLEQQ